MSLADMTEWSTQPFSCADQLSTVIAILRKQNYDRGTLIHFSLVKEPFDLFLLHIKCNCLCANILSLISSKEYIKIAGMLGSFFVNRFVLNSENIDIFTGSKRGQYPFE